MDLNLEMRGFTLGRELPGAWAPLTGTTEDIARIPGARLTGDVSLLPIDFLLRAEDTRAAIE